MQPPNRDVLRRFPSSLTGKDARTCLRRAEQNQAGEDRRAFGGKESAVTIPQSGSRALAAQVPTALRGHVKRSRRGQPHPLARGLGTVPLQGRQGVGSLARLPWVWVSRGDWSGLQCWVSACPGPGLIETVRARLPRCAGPTLPWPWALLHPGHLRPRVAPGPPPGTTGTSCERPRE